MPAPRVVLATAFLQLCGGIDGAARSAPADRSESTAIPVELVQEEGRYRLLRGGRPYEIRGAGTAAKLEALAAHGGNTVRTWSTGSSGPDGLHILDEAAAHGLTVALCIDIGRERHGFDYDDEAAVARQLEFTHREVRKYKDHAALLLWMIGNEPNLEFRNPRVFDAINDISRMIHDVDGAHPTTTALAGFSPELVGLIEQRAPDLDFLSVQLYGDALNLPSRIEEIGYDGPLLVTEWGAIGHWEVPATDWGAPIEQNSSEKAASYLAAYKAIVSNRAQVFGSYVFLWGQKQERTPTWYGMFLEDGTETEAVDVMHYLWNDAWPDNRSPRMEAMRLDGRTAHDSIVIAAGEHYTASVVANDPDGDALTFRWEIIRESEATQTGGDAEERPEMLPGLIDAGGNDRVLVTAPPDPGAYRLFVYVHDGQGNAGHANIPFRVQ
jgi:hypothetical protein